MTDIDTMLVDHFELKAGQATPIRDIDAVANGHRRLTSPIDESNKPKRWGMLAAAAVLLVAGVGGLMWSQGTRHEPASTDQAPSAPAERRSGSIDDPNAIDFSPWLVQAPAWPTGQPALYLIFDIASLTGWTQLDQTGGHQIDDGASYHWSSNVNDADGRQFNLTISNSDRFPRVVTGDDVDINGVTGDLGEGEVSWPLDDTHTATVVEFGTTDTDRVVALARQLTTTTTQHISTREPAASTGVRVDDPADGFGGIIDGVKWSATATPDATHYVIDDIVDETLGTSRSADTAEITETGNNDFCVFVTGNIPSSNATVELVLSDDKTVGLPTQPLAGGQWFTACLPYTLDAVAIDITPSDGTQPVRHQLHGPYLRPTVGSLAP